mgnify:CR=1 FL=1
MSCPQHNSENNGRGLLFKTIFWCLFCFLLFVATDGKDRNGLKLENIGAKFWFYLNKKYKKLNKYILYLTSVVKEVVVCWG